MSALERSYGLAAAQTVVDVPTTEGKDALTQYESLQGEAASAFYRANREAILAAQSARQYGARK